jgi:hypothetical protein
MTTRFIVKKTPTPPELILDYDSEISFNNTTEGFWNNYYDGYNRYYNPYNTPYYYPYYSYANLFPYYYPYYTYYTPCMQTVTGAVVCER